MLNQSYSGAAAIRRHFERTQLQRMNRRTHDYESSPPQEHEHRPFLPALRIPFLIWSANSVPASGDLFWSGPSVHQHLSFVHLVSQHTNIHQRPVSMERKRPCRKKEKAQCLDKGKEETEETRSSSCTGSCRCRQLPRPQSKLAPSDAAAIPCLRWTCHLCRTSLQCSLPGTRTRQTRLIMSARAALKFIKRYRPGPW